MPNWITEYESWADRGRYERRRRALAKAIYPTGWGNGEGPLLGPDGKPNTAWEWAGWGMKALGL